MGAQSVEVNPESKALVPATMLEVIAAVLKDPSVDPERLGKLLDFQERVDARNAEKEFYSDYALASAKMPRVIKDGVIDMKEKGRILFAKYESLDKAIRPIEMEYGFCRMFATNPTPTGIEMTMILAHRGGHSVRSTRFMPPDTGAGRNGMQAIGSASSYAKRYLTLDAWNIVTVGQDNDGGTAESISDDQYQTIKNMLDELGLSATGMKNFLQFAQAKSIQEIQAYRYDEVVLRLKEKLEQKRRGA